MLSPLLLSHVNDSFNVYNSLGRWSGQRFPNSKLNSTGQSFWYFILIFKYNKKNKSSQLVADSNKV